MPLPNFLKNALDKLLHYNPEDKDLSSDPAFRHDPVCRIPRGTNEPWQSEARNQLNPLPRMLVVIKPKQAYLDWLRQCDKELDYTLEQCRQQDSLAFLIPNTDGEIAEAEEFVKNYWQPFFVQMLSAYELSPGKWPKNRNLAMFLHWFDVEIIEWMLDLGRHAA